MLYWPSFFHQDGRILALCFRLFALPLLLFCLALLCCFFCIFNDLNFVLGHKTQKQLAFITRGIKDLFACLFIYLFIYWFICNKITIIQPVFENGWLESSNYTKKKGNKLYTPPSSFVTQVCVTPDNTGSSSGLHSKMQCVNK